MFSFNHASSKKAIAYYRHSAEDKQENSVSIQRDHTEKFARDYQIEIIHEEADEGKSGLSSNRRGFEKLFNEWILNENAPSFEYVLVYDVSRWGRFQDQDEAAFYEFKCKQRGKKVVYVSRGFPKEEQQLISHLQTSIERYMAAEYSRQLSDKVFHGCVKVSEQGYSAGGTACYGMARLLLDTNKKPIRILKKGEHKQIANERVTFIPLGDESTKTVQTMFRLLVEDWYDPGEIADWLNKQEIPSANGGKWSRGQVTKVLMNETYIGSRIYNKTWGRLKQKMKRNPRAAWTIHPNAFPSVVTQELFMRAQEHLYWLLPSKWKRGIHTINKVNKVFKAETRNLLLKKEIEEDKITEIVGNLPVLFCVTSYKDTVPNWCFEIKEKNRNFEKIVCVGTRMDTEDPIDRFFLIPTEAFLESNFLMFSERDECFSSYLVQKEKITDTLSSVLYEGDEFLAS